MRNIPANSIYLGSFEVMKSMYCERTGCKASEIPGSVVLCAAGGRCYCALCLGSCALLGNDWAFNSHLKMCSMHATTCLQLNSNWLLTC